MSTVVTDKRRNLKIAGDASFIINSFDDYVAKSREIPTPAAKQCLLLDN